METAGVDTQVFKPHSARPAATSKAKAACVSVHDKLLNGRPLDVLIYFTINQWSRLILHQPYSTVTKP